MSKKENILKAALDLFAKQGVSASPTRAIAHEAGVSEGLIFRHFRTKEALLDQVIKKGIAQIEQRFESVLQSEHPKVVLKQILSIPFQLNQHEKTFWRFYFVLSMDRSTTMSNSTRTFKNSNRKIV